MATCDALRKYQSYQVSGRPSQGLREKYQRSSSSGFRPEGLVSCRCVAISSHCHAAKSVSGRSRLTNPVLLVYSARTIRSRPQRLCRLGIPHASRFVLCPRDLSTDDGPLGPAHDTPAKSAVPSTAADCQWRRDEDLAVYAECSEYSKQEGRILLQYWKEVEQEGEYQSWTAIVHCEKGREGLTNLITIVLPHDVASETRRGTECWADRTSRTKKLVHPSSAYPRCGVWPGTLKPRYGYGEDW